MKFIQSAREAVATYGGIASDAHIELQHLLGVVIGANANPEVTGRLAQHGVRGLVNLSVQELEMAGLTHLQALQVHAAILLADKLSRARSEEENGFFVRSPEDGARYLRGILQDRTQEHFVVMFLSTKNKVIKHKTLFVGSLNLSVAHPREIFREAVKLSSAFIIVAHNHPSGDPTPSPEDIHLTKRLVEAGSIMGIELLDHIIVGDGQKYVSLKEKGYL